MRLEGPSLPAPKIFVVAILLDAGSDLVYEDIPSCTYLIAVVGFVGTRGGILGKD
jgi:hypothetical protein